MVEEVLPSVPEPPVQQVGDVSEEQVLDCLLLRDKLLISACAICLWLVVYVTVYCHIQL